MSIETNIPTDEVAPVAMHAPTPEPERKTDPYKPDTRFQDFFRRFFKPTGEQPAITDTEPKESTEPKEVYITTSAGTLGAHDVNDRLNGLRLANKFHEVAKYIPAKRMWVKWSGSGVWQFDHLDSAMNMGKNVVAGLYKEITEASISSERKASLMKDVIKHQSAPHISACVRMAQSDPRIAKSITDLRRTHT